MSSVLNLLKVKALNMIFITGGENVGEHICPSSRDWWAAMKGGDTTSVVCI